MLVLNRRDRERLCLTLPDGEEVWISVLEVDRGRVSLGITAPKSVRIEREEIYRANRPQPGGTVSSG